MQKMKIVVLLSGGLDSTTLMYHLYSYGQKLYPVAFDYDQRHRRELDSARAIAPGVQVLPFPRLRRQDPQIPNGHYNSSRMKAMVYPNRNMVMLALAAGIAVDLKADAIAYAAHAGDHTIYPDCRPEFFESCKQTIQLGNWRAPDVIAPFIHLTKAQIVTRGALLRVPFHLTWSCYKGGEKHCGLCGTCVERKEAFTLAGVLDPTEYE